MYDAGPSSAESLSKTMFKFVIAALLAISYSQEDGVNPAAPHPVLVDLLNGVGVDSIGPDSPGAYGSGLSPTEDGSPMVDSEDAVQQALDSQKAAGNTAVEENAVNAPVPQPDYPLANPDVNAGLYNGMKNPAMAGPLPAAVPDASNAFGIPPIPPMADFTLPPTPPAPSELPSPSKSEPVVKKEPSGSSTSDNDSGSSPNLPAYVLGFGAASIILGGMLLGIGMMAYRSRKPRFESPGREDVGVQV